MLLSQWSLKAPSTTQLRTYTTTESLSAAFAHQNHTGAELVGLISCSSLQTITDSALEPKVLLVSPAPQRRLTRDTPAEAGLGVGLVLAVAVAVEETMFHCESKPNTTFLHVGEQVLMV